MQTNTSLNNSDKGIHKFLKFLSLPFYNILFHELIHDPRAHFFRKIIMRKKLNRRI